MSTDISATDSPTPLDALRQVRNLALAWADLGMAEADDPNRMAAFVNEIHNIAVDAIRAHAGRHAPVSYPHGSAAEFRLPTEKEINE